jgi:hypothetical protein
MGPATRSAEPAILACLLLGVVSAWAYGQTAPASPNPQTLARDTAGLKYPAVDLEGQLKETFSILKCEYISGLSCKIRYTGAKPLPTRVFFTEFDAAGHQGGAEVRLLYPELKAHEAGTATFRLRLSSPAKVKLRGEWNGPWENPY